MEKRLSREEKRNRGRRKGAEKLKVHDTLVCKYLHETYYHIKLVYIKKKPTKSKPGARERSLVIKHLLSLPEALAGLIVQDSEKIEFSYIQFVVWERKERQQRRQIRNTISF